MANELKEFKKLHGNLEAAVQAGASLQSEDAGQRASGRDFARAFYGNLTGTQIPADISLGGDDVYDNLLHASVVQSNDLMNDYFKKNRAAVINDIPAKTLEAKALEIMPVKMPGDKPEAQRHNGAVKLHESYLAIAQLNAGYDQDKVKEDVYTAAMAQEVENEVNSRMKSQKGLSDSSKAIGVRAARMVVQGSPKVARIVGHSVQNAREKKFRDYFAEQSKKTPYKVVDYARENLMLAKQEQAIPQVIELTR